MFTNYYRSRRKRSKIRVFVLLKMFPVVAVVVVTFISNLVVHAIGEASSKNAQAAIVPLLRFVLPNYFCTTTILPCVRERERELRERISQFLLSQSLEEPPPMPLWFLRSWILCGIQILYGDSTNNLDSLLVLISWKTVLLLLSFSSYCIIPSSTIKRIYFDCVVPESRLRVQRASGCNVNWRIFGTRVRKKKEEEKERGWKLK